MCTFSHRESTAIFVTRWSRTNGIWENTWWQPMELPWSAPRLLTMQTPHQTLLMLSLPWFLPWMVNQLPSQWQIEGTISVSKPQNKSNDFLNIFNLYQRYKPRLSSYHILGLPMLSNPENDQTMFYRGFLPVSFRLYLVLLMAFTIIEFYVELM